MLGEGGIRRVTPRIYQEKLPTKEEIENLKKDRLHKSSTKAVEAGITDRVAFEDLAVKRNEAEERA
jgi:hypothetical protein